MDAYTRSAAPSPAIFVGLDGLRGLAALVVVLFHTRYMFGWCPDSGYLAVDLFFMLSGFVLAHAYDLRIGAGLPIVDFMKIRMIRLYPLYLLGVGLMVATLLLSRALRQPDDWTAKGIAASLVFAIGFAPTPNGIGNSDALYPLNPPAWSLAFELAVNLVFVLVWPRLTMRMLVTIATVSALVLVGTTVHYGSLNTGANWLTAPAGVPRICYAFTVGVILLRLYRDQAVRLPVGSVLPMMALFAALSAAPPALWRVASDLAVTLLAFPLIVLASASSQHASSNLGSLGLGPSFLSRAFRFLGVTSYAVYTLHMPLAALTSSLVLQLTARRLETLQPWIGLLFLGTLVAIAYMADQRFDAPVRSWLTRHIRRRPVM
jgi:peptidoglycan/LPS O-acetylase OafA/YrhL